jgi:exosortase
MRVYNGTLSMHRLFKPFHLQIGILLAFFVGLYLPYIQTMIRDWNTNENFSHGYFIPFISAFMVYSMRGELKKVEKSHTNWGLLLIIFGLLQLSLGTIGAEYFLQRTSMIFVFFGLCLFLAGKSFTKKAAIPILYLIFMIPIPSIVWNEIAFPMQLLASSLAEGVIQALGIPVFRGGNILQLSNTSLEVIDACSGLRSLMSMLALSGALAYLFVRSNKRKWVVFLSAIPIAILVNIIRLTLTALVAERVSGEAAHGFLHGLSGWLMFILGLALLLGVYALLSKGNRGHENN